MTTAVPEPGVTTRPSAAPIVEMRNIKVSFGGVRAVDDVSIDLYPGEVVGLVGGNGAGKSTLMKVLSGAQGPDAGEIRINGEPVSILNPRDAKNVGIETIYQTLALADNLDAPGNLFLGRELTTGIGQINDAAMEDQTRKVSLKEKERLSINSPISGKTLGDYDLTVSLASPAGEEWPKQLAKMQKWLSRDERRKE